MKKYLLMFTCIFCISALISAFYVLIGYNNSSAVIPESNFINNKKEKTENNLKVNDFTQTDIETIDKAIIESTLDFIMPINSNEIGMKFSNGQLVYSQTLGEWIMHNGIDVIAKQGTPVLASETGKIVEVSSNVQDGIKIVIEHKNGYKTIYTNLSTTKMVKEGQIIEKGQAISGVGKTATFEYNEKDHLHFEMYKDGKAINPLNLIEV